VTRFEGPEMVRNETGRLLGEGTEKVYNSRVLGGGGGREGGRRNWEGTTSM